VIRDQIARAIIIIADVYYVLLFVRIIFSWLNIRRPHPLLVQIHRITYAATEPLLRPIRNALAKYQRGVPLDFSPLVAWLLIELVRTVILRALL
jgi:YggT family protein